MRYLGRIFGMGILVLSVLHATSLWAEPNGTVKRVLRTVRNVDGSIYSTFYADYTGYYDPSGPGGPTPWPVKTSAGTKVPYMQLTLGADSRDFTNEEKVIVSARYESINSQYLNASMREGDPTLRYNCFAYALDKTAYWISDLRAFILDGDWVVPTAPEEPNCATHRETIGLSKPLHASKVFEEIVVSACGSFKAERFEGKYGASGVYKTSQGAPEGVWNAPHTKKYKS